VRVLRGVGGFYNSAVRFSADGRTLFTVGDGTLKFWRVADGRLLASFGNLSAGRLDVCSDQKHFAYSAGGTVVLARVPLWIEQVEQANDQLNLAWRGGSGFYQVQQTTNVAASAWQDLGNPTTNMTYNVLLTDGPLFFRVQSLTNAP
jgi:hypothetical protein